MEESMVIFPSKLNYFCEKRMNEKNETCFNYQKNMPLGFSTCPYGFSCYKNTSNKFCSYKIKGYFNEQKIRGHQKNSPLGANYNMTVFTTDDFLEYCVKEDLKKTYSAILEKHEIYRSTIHDIKSAIRSMGDIFLEINLDNEQKDIMDGYDLIRTRLDYHDRILMDDKQFATVINKIRVHKLIKKLTILLSYKAGTKNVEFEYCGWTNNELFSDSKAVFILLFILIENAVKYSPKDEKIIISMNDKTKQCSTILIENVCGLLKTDELPFIFDDGYRGENGDNCSGNGIGLMVAKKIMNKLHIDYQVDISRKLNKSYFSIKIDIPSLNKDGTILDKKEHQKISV